MSPLSMAASSVIPSPIHTKLPFNLTFSAHFPHSHYFSSSNPVDTIFLLRPLELANQTTSATILLRPRRLSAAGLDDLDVDRGESFTDEDEDPVTDSENHSQESEDEENGENDGVGPSNDGRTIFFNGIPFSMTSAQVTELFDGVGQVENVELIWDMIMDRSRGFGYVTMATAEEANSVMRMFNGAVSSPSSFD
ncbi:33 kDa ribonucleoprotein, chloroplastic [Linum grandiflorum]